MHTASLDRRHTTVPTELCGQVRKTFARVWVALLLAAMCAAIMLQHQHTRNEPLERDLTTYAAISQEWINGRPLYSDLWDHKPPAIHATYAAAILIAGYGPDAFYCMGVLAAIITLFGVFVAGRAYGGNVAGLWAGAFWTVSCSELHLQANQPNTEVFINCCVIWAFALFVSSRTSGLSRFGAFAIGLLIALGTLYKPIVLSVGLALAVIHLVAPLSSGLPLRRRVEDALCLVGVTPVSWVLVAFYFYGRGSLADFYDAVFLYNRYYAGPIGTNLSALFRLDAVYGSPLTFVRPLAEIALAGAVFGTLRERGRIWRAGVALALSTAVMIVLPGQFYAHYYQLWLPVLAVGGGWALHAMSRILGTRHVLPGIVGILLLLQIVAWQAPTYRLSAEEWSRQKYGSLFISTYQVGRELRTLLGENETLYHWGSETGLYYYSGKSPVTGVFYAFPLLKGPLASSLTARVLGDLNRTRPDLIVANRDVLSTTTHHAIPQWFSQRYQPVRILPQYPEFVFFARTGSPLAHRLMATGRSEQASGDQTGGVRRHGR